MHRGIQKTNFIKLDTQYCQACWNYTRVCKRGVLNKVKILFHKHASISKPDSCSGCFKCFKASTFNALSSLRHENKENVAYIPFEKYITTKFRFCVYKAISGEKMEAPNKFNKRIFISTGLVISFIGLPVSGIMNHYLGFDPMSVERHFWMSVHNVLGSFFTFFAIWHIKLNWKPIINVVKYASQKFIKREALYAISLVLFFLTLFILHSLHLR